MRWPATPRCAAGDCPAGSGAAGSWAAAALALSLWLVAPPAGGAKETDSFTHRYEALAFPEGEVEGRPLGDFTAEFNDQWQGLFAEVLAELDRENRRSAEGCRSKRARRRLFHKVSNRLGGPLVLADNRLRPAITGHRNGFPPTEKADSIYRDFSAWRSISLGLAAKLGHHMATQFRFDLARVLVESGGGIARAADGRLAVLGPETTATDELFRLRDAAPRRIEHQGASYYLLDTGQALVEEAGQVRRLTPILVSSDKFSHFFNRSLGLFKRLRAGTPEDLDRVLARNFWLEASIFGSKSTGVAAYGDLVANFQGVRFWVHLLGRGWDGRPLADPLTGRAVAPLVECSAEGSWRQTRSLDIRDYLDPAWDEGLNCSRMRTPSMARQVRQRIAQLGSEDELGRDYSCPVDAALINEAVARYGRIAPRVINAGGHGSVRGSAR